MDKQLSNILGAFTKPLRKLESYVSTQEATVVRMDDVIARSTVEKRVAKNNATDASVVLNNFRTLLNLNNK